MDLSRIQHRHAGRPAAALLLLLAAVMVLAVCVGSSDVTPAQVAHSVRMALTGQADDSPAYRIVTGIRMPRVLLAAMVGAALASAGVATQTLFRNPLASPYVLGVSSGAALGAVVGSLLLNAAIGQWGVTAMSVVGGATACAIVLMLAHRAGQSSIALLLAGIAVSAFTAAAMSLALFVAGERLASLVFWLMGGFWHARWNDVAVVGGFAMAAIATLLLMAPAMNVALLGERSARDLGVNVRALNLSLAVIVSLATASAVSVCGTIGFVGLVGPHIARLLVGADHRRVVPAAACVGAVILVSCDTIARLVVAPAEMPVGILTGLIGAPVFLFLLLRHCGRTTQT